MATFTIPPKPPAFLVNNLFDADFYRATNPDLSGLSKDEARQHFEEIGVDQGRRFSPFFDLDYYREKNLDLQNLTNRQLYNHFLSNGLTEGRTFTPFFDFDFYLESNPDLVEAGLDTTVEIFGHFLEFGLAEGRKFSPLFDDEFYRLNNPDLASAGLRNANQLINHFEVYGLDEGRSASLRFDPVYYLDTNRDLDELRLNYRDAFEHYIDFGAAEGRQGSLFYDAEAINALIQRIETQEGTQAQQTPAEDQPSRKWDVEKGGTLTYSFISVESAFSYRGSESGVGEVSETIKQNVRQIMQKYDEILPFSFVEVPDRPPSEGQIRIMFSDGPEYAYTYEPGEGIGGDLHLSRNFENDTTGLAFSSGPGSFGYESLVHEIGHALGLKHPNNYQGFALNDAVQAAADTPPFLSFAKDNNTNTSMSYNSSGLGASTPMAYDIRALQWMYGFGEFNQTDTTYKFDSSTFLQVKQSIWDAGGNDTLDFSALLANDTYFFDMNEGGRSTTASALNGSTYIGYGDSSGQTYRADLYATVIAYGATIENLIGSQGNDGILGNNENNRISGGEGADAITGARGADILTGGPGRDTFSYAPEDGGATQALGDAILDFKDGEDSIALGSGLRYEDLAIESLGADTAIRLIETGEFLTTLTGIPQPLISEADFTFI